MGFPRRAGLIGSALLLSGAAAASSAVVPLVETDGLVATHLAEARGKAATTTLIDRFSLDRLDFERGRVPIAVGAAMALDFTAPLGAVALTLEAPRSKAVLELALYHGGQPIGTQVFAHRPPASGTSVVQITGESIGLRSDAPFDGIRVRRLDPSANGDSVHVATIWTAPARGLEKSEANNIAAVLCQAPLGIAHSIAYGIALVPGGGELANAAVFASNLALKFCKTVIVAPPDIARTVPAGTCHTSFEQEHMVWKYQNALGIAYNYNSDWGQLGSPFVFHQNTEVDVMLLHHTPSPPQTASLDVQFLLETGSLEATDRIWGQCREDGSVRFSQLDGSGPIYECPYARDRVLEFPVGTRTLQWRANARIGPLDLIPIFVPGAPAGSKGEPYVEILLNVVVELFSFLIDDALSGWRINNVSDVYQQVTVYDEVPPTIVPMPFDDGRISAVLVGGILHVTIEADEAGGVSQHRYQPLLRALYEVSDACDRPVAFFASYPEERLRSFWPVSSDGASEAFDITWTARDPGPNLDGVPNETITTMRVEVVDTQPPAIVPPDDIVEVDSGEVTDLGQPMVFDFVDLSPSVSHDASLPLGLGLHFVTWTVIDASGNSASAVQTVNIKNSNLDPVALAQVGPDRAEAVSFEPTPIRLQGTDPDGDPLRFRIDDQPENGFFVAPLYPYFIEDFRIEQSITNDDLFAICNNGQGGERTFELEFPSDPEFMTVTDDGRMFVVDKGNIKCMTSAPNPSDRVLRRQRLASFGSDGSLLNARYITGDELRDVVFDPIRERIFLTSHASGGHSSMAVFDLEIQPQVGYRLQNLTKRIDGTSCDPLPQAGGGCTILRAHSSVVDDNDLIYVMIRDASIVVLDGTLPEGFDCAVDCSHTPTVVGVLEGFFAEANETGRALRLDAQGRLYASRFNRLFRYTPSFVAEDGLAYPGSLDGWLGRCDIDLAPGDQAVCDVANHRSLGFSCTDEICGVHTDFNPDEQAICGDLLIGGQPRWGCRPGQFRGTPRSIDIAPDGTLYVADFGNARIQRFSPDGFFAGQARSTGTGSGFVIGDFGNPQHVSVNSSRFYVLDPDTNLLHISLLTPFVEIGPDYADLVYQSTNQFACENSADCIDRFHFSVSDGVRDPLTGQPIQSAPAEVQVEVTRNFRPPFATPGIAAVGLEDAPLLITLDGSDPDPLDVLDFEITTAPLNGSIQLVGNQATYTPDPDSWGGDSFEFRVSDGAAVSTAEAVQITIIEVNDPPVVLPPLDPLHAGIGYEFRLDWEFIDVDPDELHTVVVDWGDGTVESEGVIAANGEPTGPLLLQSGNGPGLISASHVYTSAGTRNIEVCLTDRMQLDGDGDKIPTPDLSLTACGSQQVEAVAGLDMRLSAGASVQVVQPGQFMSYQFGVTNLQPQAGGGMPATNVVLEVDLANGFDAASINPPAGCQREGWKVTCSIGTLVAGQSVNRQIALQVRADTALGTLLTTTARVTLSEPSVNPEQLALRTTPVVPPANHYVGVDADALQDAGDANPGDGLCASAAGVCTLRAAIEESNAQPGLQVIALPHGVHLVREFLEVTDDLVIFGSGPASSLIRRSEDGRTFVVRPGASLRLESLTVSGGGILGDGDLIMRRVRMSGNTIENSFGGAILAGELLDIRDSSFDGNRSITTSGSFNDGGAIFGIGAHGVLENVTVSGGVGGGIALAGSGHFEMRHLSIVGNHGGKGWAAQAAALNVYDSTSVNLSNSVLAGNYGIGGPENCYVSATASLVSEGRNALGDMDGCGIVSHPDDVFIDAHGLKPLGIGPDGISVREPRIDSPVVDAFDHASCLPHDARGITRPQDGNEDGVSACDIGAAELNSARIFASGFEQDEP